jgi:hypothetical protein
MCNKYLTVVGVANRTLVSRVAAWQQNEDEADVNEDSEAIDFGGFQILLDKINGAVERK